jgi:hypothetical protein
VEQCYGRWSLDLEQPAFSRSPVREVQVAAMVKYNMRLQATVGRLAGQGGQAQAAAAQANVAAANAQAVATAAGNADRFRPAASPKCGNKKKDAEMRQWIPIIEDYLRTALDGEYIRLASFHLKGGLRTLWTNVYEGHGGAEPPNPRQFFRETMENKLWTPRSRSKVLGYLEQSPSGTNSGHHRVQRGVPAGLDRPGWLYHQ